MKTKHFTVNNWKFRLFRHPIEDAYRIDDEIGTIAVADGVTRDPMDYLSDGFIGRLRFMYNYPLISPARISADIFCETFPSVLRDFVHKDEKAILKAFEESNNQIGSWNSNNLSNVDYVMNDYAGCVAAGTVEQDGIIIWGFLTDCGIAIFDNEGDLMFRTEDESPQKLDEFIWQDPLIKGKVWNQPEVRAQVRRNYRNNLNEKHSYGVLTGQKDAMGYVRTGTHEIRPNDHLVVYSDGLEPIIFSSEFSDRLKQGNLDSLEKFCYKHVHSEGTLVLKKF